MAVLEAVASEFQNAHWEGLELTAVSIASVKKKLNVTKLMVAAHALQDGEEVVVKSVSKHK